MKASLPNNEKKNIAIAWQAGTAENNLLFKRIEPELLGELLSSTDANIIIIQRSPSKRDIAKLEKSLGYKSFNYSYVNDNLDDGLALLSLMDDIITVSNTNIHLNAALGKSAKILVPYPPEWRWTICEKTSPWFPNYQIYRQKSTGDWKEALRECREALASDVLV